MHHEYSNPLYKCLLFVLFSNTLYSSTCLLVIDSTIRSCAHYTLSASRRRQPQWKDVETCERDRANYGLKKSTGCPAPASATA
jgi:hypothetical protein